MAERNSISETGYARKSREEYQTDMDVYECKRCGYVYDAEEQNVPEDATYYWVPSCPYCNGKITDNPITETMIEIGLSMWRNDDDGELPDYWMGKIQTHARHLHGREVHGNTVDHE